MTARKARARARTIAQESAPPRPRSSALARVVALVRVQLVELYDARVDRCALPFEDDPLEREIDELEHVERWLDWQRDCAEERELQRESKREARAQVREP